LEARETMKAFKVLAITLIAGAAAASTAAAAGRDCFLQRNINNFAAPDNRTLYVRVGARDVYRLDLMTNCVGLTFRNGITLKGSPTGGWICNPIDATVILRRPGMNQRCPVSAIHHLAPAEILALPKRARP
jgi:hypothetical protein